MFSALDFLFKHTNIQEDHDSNYTVIWASYADTIDKGLVDSVVDAWKSNLGRVFEFTFC